MRQLLEALDALARLGVVHRDVKPENLMVSEREQQPAPQSPGRAARAPAGTSTRASVPGSAQAGTSAGGVGSAPSFIGSAREGLYRAGTTVRRVAI